VDFTLPVSDPLVESEIFDFYNGGGLLSGFGYIDSITETTTTYEGEFPTVVTKQFGSWFNTLEGQQQLAERRYSYDKTEKGEEDRDSGPDIDKVKTDYFELASVISRTTLLSTTTETGFGASPNRQKQQYEDEILEEQTEDDADPNNGYRTESTAGLTLALGSPLAKRRIEFSMPYAPDDYFFKTGTGENKKFGAIKSDAAAKARKYGRVQNNLLFGNRYGMNLQTSIGRMPTGPLSPIVICADGYCALYRVNGTAWTADPNGIIVSTDALFWGGVGTY